MCPAAIPAGYREFMVRKCRGFPRALCNIWYEVALSDGASIGRGRVAALTKILDH